MMPTSNPPLVTPNQITVTRLVLAIPLFFSWFIVDSEWARSFIVLMFVLIFISDSVDGYIAGKYDMKTTIGGLLDQAVDHISIFAFVIMLIHIDLLPLWLTFPLVFRDTLVTFLRQLGQTKNVAVSTSTFSNIKSELCYFLLPSLYFLQDTNAINIYVLSLSGLAIFMIYIYPTLFSYDAQYKRLMLYSWGFIILYLLLYIMFIDNSSVTLFDQVRVAFVSVILFFYLGSGVQYFYNNREILKASGPKKE